MKKLYMLLFVCLCSCVPKHIQPIIEHKLTIRSDLSTNVSEQNIKIAQLESIPKTIIKLDPDPSPYIEEQNLTHEEIRAQHCESLNHDLLSIDNLIGNLQDLETSISINCFNNKTQPNVELQQIKNQYIEKFDFLIQENDNNQCEYLNSINNLKQSIVKLTLSSLNVQNIQKQIAELQESADKQEIDCKIYNICYALASIESSKAILAGAFGYWESLEYKYQEKYNIKEQQKYINIAINDYYHLTKKAFNKKLCNNVDIGTSNQCN